MLLLSTSHCSSVSCVQSGKLNFILIDKPEMQIEREIRKERIIGKCHEILKTTVTCRLLCTQFPPLRSLVSSSSFFFLYFFFFSFFVFSHFHGDDLVHRQKRNKPVLSCPLLVLPSSRFILRMSFFLSFFLFPFFSLSNSQQCRRN